MYQPSREIYLKMSVISLEIIRHCDYIVRLTLVATECGNATLLSGVSH